MALLRYALYIVGIAVFTGLLAWIEISTPGALKLHVMESPTDLFGTSEYSPVEKIQLALLGICALLYAWVAKTFASQRPIAFAFGGLALACGIRELHFFFDQNVADNFWQVLVAIILALLIVYTLPAPTTISHCVAAPVAVTGPDPAVCGCGHPVRVCADCRS